MVVPSLFTVRPLRRNRVALALLAVTTAACSASPSVAVEESMRSPQTTEVEDAATNEAADAAEPTDDEPDEAPIDEAPIAEPEETGQLEAAEEPPMVEEPVGPTDGEEAAQPEEAAEPFDGDDAEGGSARAQIDDVAWTIPGGNDRWDLNSDGEPDTVPPNPWQIIDANLPTADELGSEWDSSYRSTSIVSGTIIPGADTDCPEFDVVTGVNNEYHGTQTWEREGESIRAFVVALDDSIQAAGIAGMLGDLSTRCATVGADPARDPGEAFRVLRLSRAHDGLDGVLLEYPDGTRAQIVARSHGALLHIVALVTWNSSETSALASTGFETVVASVVESTPGAERAVDPGPSPLASVLPSGDDAGLEWGDVIEARPTYGADASESTCAARAAFAAAEDRFEVGTSTTFETEVYAGVSLGAFESAAEAGDAMADLAELAACRPPDGYEALITAQDSSIDAGGHPVVPFTFGEDFLDGGTLDGVVITVGPYVAVVVVYAFPDLLDPDAAQPDSSASRQQLQLIVDHTVAGLETIS